MSTHQAIEVKKDGLSQLQDGSWVLKLKVHPNDMPTSLMVAPMGTRYQAALVELDDDEQPVVQPAKKLGLSQEAGMHCQRPTFWVFLSEMVAAHEVPVRSAAEAAVLVRDYCKVSSRAEFDSNQGAAAYWIDLRGKFKAWELVA